mmetsp:Transcript_1509/g.2651  ORF Transcript_1509/g.2651 Transcript_1509/m.2651 type:complete len:205 (+) Transcript_1509:85-699(+)
MTATIRIALPSNRILTSAATATFWHPRQAFGHLHQCQHHRDLQQRAQQGGHRLVGAGAEDGCAGGQCQLEVVAGRGKGEGDTLRQRAIQDVARDGPGDEEHQQKVAEQRHTDPEDAGNTHLSRQQGFAHLCKHHHHRPQQRKQPTGREARQEPAAIARVGSAHRPHQDAQEQGNPQVDQHALQYREEAHVAPHLHVKRGGNEAQ